ncbi:ABC transporter substrate-binding protein [Bradyrhizobium liaoningense]
MMDITRRRLLKGAASAVSTLALPGAPAIAQSARRDMRVGIWGGDFGNISPVVRWDIQAGLPMLNIFDNLVRIDYQNRKLLPHLAEDWTSPEPGIWRIKLREGVKWHRGYGEVTAEDLAYTWRYHLESKSFQVGIALFAIDTVKTDGKYVVEVKTKRPFGAFPGVVMGYAGMVISQSAHKEMGNQAYSAKPIGQGPYMVEAVRGNELDIVRNPDYWRSGYPKLDKLLYRAIPDSSVRLAALIKGELDFMTHPEAREVAEAAKNTKYTTLRTPGWNWDYQQFNLKGDPKARFQNKLVRQAISYAIDREAIVKEIYNGEATVTDNQIPGGYMGYRDSLLRYPKNGDLKKAAELLAQAGVKGYEVEVITSDKDWLRRELELVAAMVSQIGINYKIRNLDMGGFNNLWLNQKFEQHLEDITLVAPDPDATSWWFLNSKGTTSALNDPQMDALTDSARSESDSGKRETLYHQIVDKTLEDCPLVYHCNVNMVRIFDKRLSGFTPSPQEYVELHDATSWVS